MATAMRTMILRKNGMSAPLHLLLRSSPILSAPVETTTHFNSDLRLRPPYCFLGDEDKNKTVFNEDPFGRMEARKRSHELYDDEVDDGVHDEDDHGDFDDEDDEDFEMDDEDIDDNDDDDDDDVKMKK